MTSRDTPATLVGRSILVADDEVGLRDLSHFLLEPLGYEVVSVADGIEATEAIARRSFDLVILDVHMPRMGGPEAFAEIRRLRPAQRIVVVSSSLKVDRVAEEELLRGGVVTCLFKPVTLEELLGAIEDALSNRAGED